MLKKIFLFLIVLYQKTLSPDHGLLKPFFPGGVCRYQPTCSQYMYEAVCLHGLYGLSYGVGRVLRCHPWGGDENSGYDPVKKR